MATPKQITANRLNSQKSTGPRTAAGKLVSSMNALQSGLHAQRVVVPGEDEAAFQALTAEYYAEFHPVTPQERDLVDTLVHDQWIIRRLRRVESEMVQYQYDRIGGYRDELMGQIYRTLSEHLARIQSRLNSLERSYHRTLKELRTLAAAHAPDPTPDPVPEPTAISATSPETAEPGPPQIGFVPSKPPQAAPTLVPGPRPAAVESIDRNRRSPDPQPLLLFPPRF